MLRAIIIDDDEEDLVFIKEALEATESFAAVEGFTHGKEALAYLYEAPHEVHVIITDLNMPMVSGFDVLEAVKGSDKLAQIPVVVFSTSSNTQDVEKAKELGAIQFITKPNSYGGYSDTAKEVLVLIGRRA